MATPNIGNTHYTQTTVSGLSSANKYYVAMMGATLYAWDDGNVTVHRLTGSGTTVDVPSGSIYPRTSDVSPGFNSKCFGVSPDGTLLFFAEYARASGNRIITMDTTTGTFTVYANTVSANYIATPYGSMYVQNNTTCYLTDTSSSGPFAGSIVKVTLGAGTFTTSAQSTSVGGVNLSGCTLFGSDNLTTLVFQSGANYLPYYCSLSTSGQSLTAISSVAAHPYEDLTAINGLSANSTTYDFLMLLDLTNGIIYQFTISGSVGTQVATNTGLTTPCISITGSDVGGNQTGNMRLFVGAGNAGSGSVVKLWNDPSASGGPSTGPTGVSTGGDPHTHTLTGKSVIIVREKPFEYLDTHPLSFGDDGDVKTYISCDCFSLKNDYDNFSSQLPEEHVKELITNLDDSYLKYVTFYVGDRRYVLNMVTLLLEDEGEAGGKGRNQTNAGSIKNESVGEGEINFSRIEFFEPGKCSSLLKSKYVVNSAFAKRNVSIKAREYSLSIDFTRTGCIHLSDMYLEISGRRDPFSFGGVIVDGEVKSPKIEEDDY